MTEDNVSCTFCPLPFMNLRILNDGTFNPCCVTFSPYRDANGRPYLADRDSIRTVWNSDHAQRLRSDLANGRRPSECKACWDVEDQGLQSYRQRMVEEGHGVDPVDPIARDDVEFLIIRYGNVCNLKCRICDPISSSKWIPEHNAQHGIDWLSHKQAEMAAEGNRVDRRKIMNWFDDNPGFWSEVRDLLPSIRKLQISGGEPFLVEEKIRLLRECVELGHADHMDLSLLTNGTVMDRQLIEEMLPRFKSVCLSFSIDATGKQFEYLRHGAKWEAVDANLRHAVSVADGSNLTVLVAMTVGSMNAMYLPEYGDYFNDVGVDVILNTTYDKPAMEIPTLPFDARLRMAERIRSADPGRLACYRQGLAISDVLHLLESRSESENMELFATETRRMDLYRGEDFTATFPELASLIGYDR